MADFIYFNNSSN